MFFVFLFSQAIPSFVHTHTHRRLHMVLPVCFNTWVNLIRCCWVLYSVTHPIKWGHCEKSPFALDGLWYQIRHSYTRYRYYFYQASLPVLVRFFFLIFARKKQKNQQRDSQTMVRNESPLMNSIFYPISHIKKPISLKFLVYIKSANHS